MYLSLESETEFSQLCPTLCYPVDCSLPGSSVHGILQVRVLEWVAISFSRGSSRPRNWTQVSGIAGRCFTIWATSEAHLSLSVLLKSRGKKWNKKALQWNPEDLWPVQNGNWEATEYHGYHRLLLFGSHISSLMKPVLLFSVNNSPRLIY